MNDIIKKTIKKQLHNMRYKKYLKEVSKQQNPYEQWILCNEDWKKDSRNNWMPKVTGKIIPMERFCRGFLFPKKDVLIFVRNNGFIDAKGKTAILEFFHKNKEVKIAYADEDCIDEKGKRHTPWFKPAWSPDTLSSFAYYGDLLAIRTDLLTKFLQEEKQDLFLYEEGEKNVYHTFLTVCKSLGRIASNEEAKPIKNINHILFHRYAEQNYVLSDPDAAFSDTVYLETEKPDLLYDDLTKEKEVTKFNSIEDTISIIIPSKDQPEVLKTCVDSVRKVDKRVEIIVVDNGSSACNRLKVEELCRLNKANYLYVPMEFNFSKMCNIGAENATGNFLLFLNDDMEIIQDDWLIKMLESARLPHVGAVGAKLLYPGTDLIQHVGVTNLAVGPAHKLLKLSDKNIYYHGQNRHNYDMIAVTAACLMVEREKFQKVKGFREELAVAYNDVDFCFALYEQGFYNVQRNDVTLFHHESLSRGDDLLSEEKKERLLLERKILYDRYPDLKGKDPFYNKNLAGGKHMYLCNYLYPYEQEDHYMSVIKMEESALIPWENNCLMIKIDKAEKQDQRELEEEIRGYHIEGWSYVLEMDNSHYERFLIFMGENGEIYQAEVAKRLRKDVERVLQGQIHVKLAGFACRIARNTLPNGIYNIGMLAKDTCSKQQLYKMTTNQLVVEE